MIQNSSLFTSNKKFHDAIKILDEGLTYANPQIGLSQYFSKNKIKTKKSIINLKKFDNVYIIAIGKAADSMAKFVSSKIDLKSGIIVIPSNYELLFHQKNIRIFKAGHPLPNTQSLKAGKYIKNFIASTTKNDFIVFLISGGGSALVTLPSRISLKEKVVVNQKLIQCGANINEISCVRKHLSEIKGGKLVETMPCAGISFVLSDVVSDDLTSISSGMTYADKTTFSDAIKIIKKYKIETHISKNVISVLNSGKNGNIKETPTIPKLNHIIIGNNKKSLIAMKDKSKKLGYSPCVISNLNSNVKAEARKIAKKLKSKTKSCIIFGGETTVNVMGTGKGGRNQEFVLQLSKELKNTPCVISSIGTDGIDGNTKFAGAIVSTINIKPFEIFLKNNDSFNYFRKYGGLILTGPTHTNVNDIGVIIKQTL
jgi:hydroxypyruvate reductase